MKGTAAMSLSAGSMSSGVHGSKMLIIIVGCVVVVGCIMSGHSERVHVLGQCVKASWEVVQLTSGLWALSQSVPRMMSWSSIAVT